MVSLADLRVGSPFSDEIKRMQEVAELSHRNALTDVFCRTLKEASKLNALDAFTRIQEEASRLNAHSFSSDIFDRMREKDKLNARTEEMDKLALRMQEVEKLTARTPYADIFSSNRPMSATPYANALFTSRLSESLRKIQEQTDVVGSSSREMQLLQDRLHDSDGHGGLRGIAQRIKQHQKDIDSLRPHIREHHLPRVSNPLNETNTRLANIDKSFDRMQATFVSIDERFNSMEEIAIDGAKIAASLQASAADFLIKFETAAATNNYTVRWTLRLAVVAIVIALGQIAYTEWWRVPRDAAATQAMISEMESEITTLRNAQRAAAEEISDALVTSNTALTDTLHELRNLLAEQKGLTREPTDAKEEDR